MIAVKICGLRRMEDIKAANALLPDYIGFVFAPSRRKVAPAEAAALRKALDDRIRAVGVFVNAPAHEVAQTAADCRLTAVQLHGDEDGGYIKTLRPLLPVGCAVFKAARVKSADDIAAALVTGADRLLLDAFCDAVRGGTGKSFDWSLLATAPIGSPFFVAGGITPDNVNEAVAAARSAEGFYGVDVSGGVETDGYKDFEKMKALIDAVRQIKR
jgi:phosphoribosylanthranilate isomerase